MTLATRPTPPDPPHGVAPIAELRAPCAGHPGNAAASASMEKRWKTD